ncbi:TPA: YggS family pyridoxal phosphate enzyme, partial [Morganella morganii]
MKPIKDNLTEIRERITAAAQKCGRDPHTVTLLAVSKTKP